MSNTNQILNELNATVGGFTGSVNVKVDKVNEITNQIRENADITYREINNFKQSMIENEQMQNAQENILRINQIIRERFSDYDDVRHTVMGVVKDFDINLVRNKTMTSLSEELWITSSRYWLSYTLIAITAWVSDNAKISKSAVTESCRIDKIKTSLFFCLMNLRFNRIDAAREWLCEYFDSVVPSDISDETAILLQSYINGLFGVDKEIEYTVKDIVDGWVRDINIDDSNKEELTSMYLNYISNLPLDDKFKDDYISKYCDCYDVMKHPYGQANKLNVLIEKIESINVENIIQNAADYKARVDSVLRDLITNYDKEEQELKEQQEYYNLIIENNGKEEIAERQFTEILERRQAKENFGQKCIEWALYSRDDSINVHVKKFGFQNTKIWFLEALDSWTTEYESKFPEEYPISIEDWSCTSNGEDHAEQKINLREHLEKNKFKIKYINKLNVFLTIISILFVAIVALLLYFKVETIIIIIGAVVTFIPLLVLLIRILTANKKFKKKVNKLLAIFDGTMTEITNYRKEYFENKDKKAKLYALIEQL